MGNHLAHWHFPHSLLMFASCHLEPEHHSVMQMILGVKHSTDEATNLKFNQDAMPTVAKYSIYS